MLISDLLFPSERRSRSSPRVAQGGRGAASLVVVQVLAASDVDPPPRGNLRLVDSETDAVREVFIDAVAEARYRQNLARHIENWHNACRQVGATAFVSVVAEKLVDRWDLEPLVMAEVLRVE